jgi:hypothetical protein
MGASYTFIGNVLRIDFEGVYPADAAMDVFQRALEDPAFPENARLLIDVTRSESLADRRTQDLKTSVDFFANAIERVGKRGAILAASEFQSGMMRMAAVYAETLNVECKVFSTEGEAVRWLNRDLPGEND